MKKQTLPLIAFWFCSQAFALSGNQTIVDKELNEVTQYGNLTLEEVTVKNETKVHGVLRAKDSHLNQVTVHGQTKLETSSVAGALTIHGSADIEESELNGSVAISGETEIEESNFSGDVTISGHTEIEDSNFKSNVSIHGGTEIDESTFEKDLKLKGHLECSSSTLNNVFIQAYDISFEDSTINGHITVEKSRRDEPQVLKLINTQVHGSINFESDNGVVEKDGNSKIEGQVNGGRVVTAEDAD